jgi:hypothetical protein
LATIEYDAAAKMNKLLGETQEHCVASKMEIEGLCSTILFTV